MTEKGPFCNQLNCIYPVHCIRGLLLGLNRFIKRQSKFKVRLWHMSMAWYIHMSKISYLKTYISYVAYWKWDCLMAVVDNRITKSQRWQWTQMRNFSRTYIDVGDGYWWQLWVRLDNIVTKTNIALENDQASQAFTATNGPLIPAPIQIKLSKELYLFILFSSVKFKV